MRAVMYSNGDPAMNIYPKGWYAWNRATLTYEGPLAGSFAAYKHWGLINGETPKIHTPKSPTIYTMGDDDRYLDENGLPLDRGWYARLKSDDSWHGPHKSMRLAYINWCQLNGREPKGETARGLDQRRRKVLPALDLRLDADLPENIRALLDKPY